MHCIGSFNPDDRDIETTLTARSTSLKCTVGVANARAQAYTCHHGF